MTHTLSSTGINGKSRDKWILFGARTSSSCRFPEAFIRIVAILSPSTVRVDWRASWSPASPSPSLSASSSEKHVCNSPISSCSIRISSIRAWADRSGTEWWNKEMFGITQKNTERKGRPDWKEDGETAVKVCSSKFARQLCYKQQLYQLSPWSWHSNWEQCHAVCAAIARPTATLNPSIIPCIPWAGSLFFIIVFSQRNASSLLYNFYVIRSEAPSSSFRLTHMNTTQLVKSLSHLVCSHLALGALVGLQALTECSFDGLHFGGDGLKGLLIMLLPLQSLIQTLLLFTDLRYETRRG